MLRSAEVDGEHCENLYRGGHYRVAQKGNDTLPGEERPSHKLAPRWDSILTRI